MKNSIPIEAFAILPFELKASATQSMVVTSPPYAGSINTLGFQNPHISSFRPALVL